MAFLRSLGLLGVVVGLVGLAVRHSAHVSNQFAWTGVSVAVLAAGVVLLFISFERKR